MSGLSLIRVSDNEPYNLIQQISKLHPDSNVHGANMGSMLAIRYKVNSWMWTELEQQHSLSNDEWISRESVLRPKINHPGWSRILSKKTSEHIFVHCTGSRVNTNYNGIVSWARVWFPVHDFWISETHFATHKRWTTYDRFAHDPSIKKCIGTNRPLLHTNHQMQDDQGGRVH